MEEPENSEWLLELLSNVQLEQFYVRIRDELQVSRLQHFEYVQSEDLEKIGMSKPPAKRLLDILKKRRLKSEKKDNVIGGAQRKMRESAKSLRKLEKMKKPELRHRLW